MVEGQRRGPGTLTFLCAECDRPIPLSSCSTSAPARCAGCGRAHACDDGILVLGCPAEPDDYPDDFYALLADVERRHFWFGERNRLILSTMRETIGPLQGRSVLDIGCGTGFVLAALEDAGMTVCGLDMNPSALRYARKRTRGMLLCQDAASVPFSEQFDVVMLCDVIEHARDDRFVLRQARRALKTGGALVVTVPAHPRLWTALDEASGHKRRYTRRSLVEAMREAGFLVCLSRHFNTLLYPVQSLRRHILDGQPIATSAERLALVQRALRVPPGPLNALMRLAMAADLVLSRLPGSLGTSLIAIAFRP